jgi:DNA-binding NtrC family response regulator
MPSGPSLRYDGSMVETRTRVLNWFVRGGVLVREGGERVPVDVDPVVVGRADGVQAMVDDPEVSALHCELRAVTEGIVLRDLGSTNGTFIGKVRVREVLLGERTEILVGQTKLVVEPTGKRRVDVGFSASFGGLVGSSPRMRRVYGVLEKVAPTPLSILILGETGTGKEVVAKAVHDASPRKGGPFVVVDCGSIPPTLAESLLFGHEKGAFTGATERRKGALAEASGGTLFLDELGELPIELQPKLLRALAERQVKRVGASTFEPIDVRLLAATRRDLGVEMNAGRFRSDLFFRIAQVRVEMPALRERIADIPEIVAAVCERQGLASKADAVIAWVEKNLANHDWPGNVRELVNVAEVAATLADTPEAIDDVLTLVRPEGSASAAAIEGGGSDAGFTEAKRASVAAFERQYFTELSESTKGNVSEMARRAGMERHHVRAYLRKYGIR